MTRTPRTWVYQAIDGERDHQERKHGDKQHSVPGWLLIMRGELQEAEQAWLKYDGDRAALDEIRQVIATGVACMEQHGVVYREDDGNG